MSAIWVTKEKIQTLWGILHNIRIRMQENISYPGVKISGSGLKATMNIDLPQKHYNSEYNGYFKVIDTSDEGGQEITVLDGLFYGYPDVTDAGYCVISGYHRRVLSASFSITTSCAIYIECDFDDTGDEPGVPTLVKIDSIDVPGVVDGKCRILVSRIMAAGGSITRFTQEVTGMPSGDIYSDCDTSL